MVFSSCLFLLLLELLHGGGQILHRPVHQGQVLQALLLTQLLPAYNLKSTASRNFFQLWFFKSSNLFGYMIHNLKYFRVWFGTRGDTGKILQLCTVSTPASLVMYVHQRVML